LKLGTFTKTPVERKRYTLDYTDWLDTGETVTGCVFTVSPSTGVTPFIIDASAITGSGLMVTFFANYGVSGVTYVVDVLMTTSGGQTKEDQINFVVKAL
jgi:hypothetical protein